MQLTINGKQFDVELSGDSPYMVYREVAGKIVPLATGDTKAEAVNNAIEYLKVITTKSKD